MLEGIVYKFFLVTHEMYSKPHYKQLCWPTFKSFSALVIDIIGQCKSILEGSAGQGTYKVFAYYGKKTVSKVLESSIPRSTSVHLVVAWGLSATVFRQDKERLVLSHWLALWHCWAKQLTGVFQNTLLVFQPACTATPMLQASLWYMHHGYFCHEVKAWACLLLNGFYRIWAGIKQQAIWRIG